MDSNKLVSFTEEYNRIKNNDKLLKKRIIIIHPKTKQKFVLQSPEGKKLLKKYIESYKQNI